MAVKIGIPRALAYYAYGDLWANFFKHLGCDVLISPPTNKGIVDAGTKETIGEACIPIKVFHGHVLSLIDKADFIFIPRLININKHRNITFCPKFLGLPDLVVAQLHGVKNILAPDIVIQGRKWCLIKPGAEIANTIGVSRFKGILAILRALWDLKKKNETRQLQRPVFGIIGYPYFLHDKYMNFNLVEILQKNGVQVIYGDEISDEKLFKHQKKIPKDLFWEFSHRTLLAAYSLLADEKVDGIIHLSAFACGPDAMLGKLLEFACREYERPLLQLTIDEHTGEAGVRTRLEAFIDMLLMRRRYA